MEEAPKGYTLERIDNNSGYSPDNCKWATRREQSRNVRNNRIVVIAGQKMCLIEAIEKLGLSKHESAIRTRIAKGWDVYKALQTPIVARPRS